MPKYTIQSPDGRKITIEAVDEATAVRGAQEWTAANPKQSSKDKALVDARKATKGAHGIERAATQGLLFNYGDELQGAANYATVGAQNALGRIGIGKANPYSAREAYDATVQAENETINQFAREKPVTSAVAGVAGGLANPLNKVGVGYVAKGGSLANVATRSAVVGAATGAAYGSGEGRTLKDRGQNAFMGGTTGAVIGGALPVVGAGAKSMAGSIGRKLAPASSSKDVKALQNAGVDLTYGEMMGGTAKRIEDALSTISGGIRSARDRGQQQLNRAVINKALAPIGEKLDDATPVGREAISEMIDKTGAAMQKAYAGARFKPDQKFGANLRQLATRHLDMADDTTRAQAQTIINNLMKGPTTRNGEITGKGLSALVSKLSTIKRDAYRAGGPSQFADFINDVEREVFKGIRRQKTGDIKAIADARRAYALSLRPEQAANFLGGESGVFNASQLQNTVKRFAGGARGREFARGRAPLQDISDPAKNVMGTKIGSSGTAERALVLSGTASLGGLLTGNPVLYAGIAAELVSRAAYSGPVLKIVNGLARAQTPGAVQSAINSLKRLSATNPQAKGALTQIIARATADQKANQSQQARERPAIAAQ